MQYPQHDPYRPYQWQHAVPPPPKQRPDYKFIALALVIFSVALQLGGIAITVLDTSPLGALCWLAGLALTAAAIIPIWLL